MKRYDHLYAEVTSFENLWLAEKKAARGKRGQGAVAAFEFNLEDELLRLADELAPALDVNRATIKRDLAALCAAGEGVLTRGSRVHNTPTLRDR